MPNEVRTVSYDGQLKIVAYRFEGIMQKFIPIFYDKSSGPQLKDMVES